MSVQELGACLHRATRGWAGLAAFALVAPAMGVLVARVVQPYTSPATAAAETPRAHHSGNAPEFAEKTHWFRPLRADEREELDAASPNAITSMSSTPLMKLAGEPSAATSRVEIIADVPEITPPAMGVSSIMATKSQPIAVVGGKLLRVGDEVSPGWKIGAINPDAGTVVLQHESGFEHTLNLRP